MGRRAPDVSVAKNYGVLACVNKLVTIGCNLSTYFSRLIQAIDAHSSHDLVGFCASMARNNWNDVVSKSQPPTLCVYIYL